MAFAASEQPVTELPGSDSFLGNAGSAKGLERAGGCPRPAALAWPWSLENDAWEGSLKSIS